jgi:hypothetical protein
VLKRSLVVILAFLFFLVLATGSFIEIGGSLHGRYVSGRERSKWVIIKPRHGKGKSKWVIIKPRHGKGKLIDAHLQILMPLVAEEHVLALTGVTAPSKYALEHPQDTIGGGGRGS